MNNNYITNNLNTITAMIESGNAQIARLALNSLRSELEQMSEDERKAFEALSARIA